MIYWENIEHIFRYRLDMFKITSIVNLDISSDQVFCCPGGSRSPELPQHFSDWGGGRCRDSWHGKRCAWHAIWLQEGRVFFFLSLTVGIVWKTRLGICRWYPGMKTSLGIILVFWDSFGISSPRALLKMIFLLPSVRYVIVSLGGYFILQFLAGFMMDLNLSQRLSFGSSWNPMWFSQNASGENHINRIIQD